MKKKAINVPDIDLSCICCGKKIKSLYTEEQKDIPAVAGNYDRAIVDKISGNYGSAFDGETYLIAICDSCIAANLKRKNIIYLENWLHDFVS